MIRVAIADDHPELRTALRLLLGISPNIEIVFEAENGREAVECVQHHQPDVLVMDIFMPELDGLAATKQIANLPVATRIILISNNMSLTLQQQAANAGAYGFIDKYELIHSLLSAIETVYQGGRHFVY